ncbi:MAG: hypothetical protein HY816_05605 [Candidatus Wallbacteria bacterium]|nr:hypothetical protein [Candidatus Wallbacteria bacterium]
MSKRWARWSAALLLGAAMLADVGCQPGAAAGIAPNTVGPLSQGGQVAVGVLDRVAGATGLPGVPLARNITAVSTDAGGDKATRILDTIYQATGIPGVGLARDITGMATAQARAQLPAQGGLNGGALAQGGGAVPLR